MLFGWWEPITYSCLLLRVAVHRLVILRLSRTACCNADGGDPRAGAWERIFLACSQVMLPPLAGTTPRAAGSDCLWKASWEAASRVCTGRIGGLGLEGTLLSLSTLSL